jgi:hypothetical protein
MPIKRMGEGAFRPDHIRPARHAQFDAGQVYLWPMRAGSVIESYHYPSQTGGVNPPTLVYLSTYGNFSRSDDLLCTRFAREGYNVFGIDPLRYLLHASTNRRLKPEDLWDDMQQLAQMLPGPPVILAQPVAAGLAILWASNISKVRGVIAVGKAQASFAPGHIFANNNPYTFLLSRYVGDLAPRPFALVQIKGHPLGADDQEIAALANSSKPPAYPAARREIIRQTAQPTPEMGGGKCPLAICPMLTFGYQSN